VIQFPGFGIIWMRRDEIKALSFWERHGTNSTWDPFGFCSLEREGKQWLRKPISLLSTSMSRTAGRLEARSGEASAIGSRYD
jgi:hypothetical protein